MYKILALTLLTSLFCQAQSRMRQIPTSDIDHKVIVLDGTTWDLDLEKFQKKHAHLKFEWQTESKKALRSTIVAPIFGIKSGETIVSSKKGKVSRIKFSIFNRGDHGMLSASVLDKRFNTISSALTEATGKKPRDISKNGAVKITSYLWKTQNSAYLLEKSYTANRSEFLRLRVAPLKEARSGNKTQNRSKLKNNVQKDPNGDVYVKDVPMVDQGQKGYCAAASAARIYQYYGREVSMHEVAKMAGTDNQGTNPVKMIAGLKKAAGKLNTRVVMLYEYPKHMTRPQSTLSESQLKATYREAVSDMNRYQTLAKKKKKKLLTIDGKPGGKAKKGYMYNILYAQHNMDPDVYREVMMNKRSFKQFKQHIKRYIDQGVPVAWALQLGMFKEEGIPQMGGGHMRLIIGYNEKKDTIIYSDSWGKGHGKKSMDAGNAFSMTNVILTLPPSR